MGSRFRRRGAGILLHPTALPSPFGIGDLGPGAESFVRWAAAAGQSYWQVLPLGPTGFGDSPYGALSSFAGNPMLVSPELLAADGLLEATQLQRGRPASRRRIPFGRVRAAKEAVLRRACARFGTQPPAGLAREFEAFVSAEADWLEDWALFSALKNRFDGRAWTHWEADLRRRVPGALAAARRSLGEQIACHRLAQFLFFRQWERLRRLAHELGIEVIGDLPIYVALDSADVWARPDLFDLDARSRPRAVSGVPPDYFSATGQLWGNPIYRWSRHREENFAWWRARLQASFRLTDWVRVDHFRGFAAYWRVSRGAETAARGRWVIGPGLTLFKAVRRALGELPLIAEDLGVITPDVRALLDATGFPRMKVLQFAFAEPDSEHLPHHHLRNAVVYTGTHDNDTVRGWFAGAGNEEKQRALDYLGLESGSRIADALIRAAYTSVADVAIVPLQDLLGLGSRARMNFPGRPRGNWAWRARGEDLDAGVAARLRRLAEVAGRLPAADGSAGREQGGG